MLREHPRPSLYWSSFSPYLFIRWCQLGTPAFLQAKRSHNEQIIGEIWRGDADGAEMQGDLRNRHCHWVRTWHQHSCSSERGLLSAEQLGLGLCSHCVTVNAGIHWQAGLLLANLIKPCLMGWITAMGILKGWCHAVVWKWKWVQVTVGSHPLTSLFIWVCVLLRAGWDCRCCGQPFWSRSSILAGWEWNVQLELSLVFSWHQSLQLCHPSDFKGLFKALGVSETKRSKEKRGTLVCLPWREFCRIESIVLRGILFPCACDIERMAAGWGTLFHGASRSLCSRLWKMQHSPLLYSHSH